MSDEVRIITPDDFRRSVWASANRYAEMCVEVESLRKERDEAVANVERLQRVRDAAEAFDREWERGDTIGEGIAAVNAFRDTLARLDKENQG